MNPGTFTDSSGAIWDVERRLSRGSWTTTWLVSGDEAKRAVLTTSLCPADLGERQVAPPALFAACAQAVKERASELATQRDPVGPRLLATGTLADGRPAFVTPAYPCALADTMDERPLAETLSKLARLARLLEVRSRAIGAHGNLQPTTVLLDDDGQLALSEPLPTCLVEWRTRLEDLRGGRGEFLPPETYGAPQDSWDTWAVCAMAWRACRASGPGSAPAVPTRGLDKLGLAQLRDATLARLKASGANPRFAPRAADRMATLLHRGLSQEHEPSPPFRFRTAGELAERLEEVVGLVAPSLERIGALLLARPTGQGSFTSDEAVRFSVMVTPSCKLDSDEVAAAIRLEDLDRGSRVPVPEARFTVKTHPSGRLRFEFELPGVAPGRYQAKVAFLIKDSAQPPATAEGELEVRPSPGWVPPREVAPAPAPLQLPRATSVRRARPVEPVRTQESGEVHALFPAPLSPTPPPSDPDVEEEVQDLASGRGPRVTGRTGRRGPQRIAQPPRAPVMPSPVLTATEPGRVVALGGQAGVALVPSEPDLEEPLPSPSETEPDLLELAGLGRDPETQPRDTPERVRALRIDRPTPVSVTPMVSAPKVPRAPVPKAASPVYELPPPPPPPRMPAPTPTPSIRMPAPPPAVAVSVSIDHDAATAPEEAPESDWDPDHHDFFAEEPTQRDLEPLPLSMPLPLGGGEPLEGWRERVKLPQVDLPLPPWADKALDLLRNDSYSAVMAGVLGVFIVLFLLILAFS